MSKVADQVYDILKQLFPHNLIIKEHYVKYRGVRLFFDIYIKDLQVLLEIQGVQHDKYVGHFHGDKEGFIASKKRDNFKIEFCELNRIPFVIVEYNEKINSEILLNKILDSVSFIVRSSDDRHNNKK